MPLEEAGLDLGGCFPNSTVLLCLLIVKKIAISGALAKFFGCKLPIMGAGLDLLFETNGLDRCFGPFGFVVCPTGLEKVKVSFGFCD